MVVTARDKRHCARFARKSWLFYCRGGAIALNRYLMAHNSFREWNNALPESTIHAGRPLHSSRNSINFRRFRGEDWLATKPRRDPVAVLIPGDIRIATLHGVC
jgi:hypothetical protein